MATAVIETLLQTTVPPRPPETGGNGAEGGRFKPALDQALRAEASGAPDATTGLTASDDDAAIANEDLESADGYEQGDAASTDVAEDAAADQATNDESAEADGDDDDHDAVEISEAAAAEAAAEALAVPVNTKTEPATATADATVDVAEKVEEIANKTTPPGQKSPPAKPIGAEVGPSGRGEDHTAQQAAESNVPPNDGGTDNEAEKRAKPSVDSATKVEGTSETNAARSGAEGGEHAPEHDDSQDGSLPQETAAGADSAAKDDGVERRPATPAAPKAAEALNADRPAPVAAPDAAAAASPDQVAAAAAAPTPAEPLNPTRGSPSLAMLAAGRALQGNSEGAEHGASPVDRGRFLGRVEGAIRTAQQRDGRINVRLSPPELGALRIELTLQHGVMNARIEAETTSARNLLLDNLPALRDRLAQQDIRVDRFDVDVRRDGAGSNPQNANDRPTGDSGSGPQDERRRDRAPRIVQAIPSRRAVAPRSNGNAELDVRV